MALKEDVRELGDENSILFKHVTVLLATSANKHHTRTLFVIFTILVSFSRDNALFALKAKINVVWNFFERSGSEGASGVRINFKQR